MAGRVAPIREGFLEREETTDSHLSSQTTGDCTTPYSEEADFDLSKLKEGVENPRSDDEGPSAIPRPRRSIRRSFVMPNTGIIYMEPLPQERSKWMISPQSPYRLAWDGLVAVLVLFVAIVSPYRIAFSDNATGAARYFEFFMDCAFFVDVVLNFRTGFFSAKGEVVMDANLVRRKYLRRWFWVDIIASLPLSIFLEGGSAASKLIKVLRSVKLFRLARLLRQSSLVSATEDLIIIHRTRVQLLKLSLITIYVAHLQACIWYWVGTMGDDDQSWLHAASEKGLLQESFSSKYLVSFYWSVVTLTTLGFGDITPKNQHEMLAAVILSLFGGGYFGFIVAHLASVASQLNSASNRYFDKLGAVQSYMNTRALPHDLQVRIRQYYKFFLNKRTSFEEKKILRELPVGLRHAVATHVMSEVADMVPFLVKKDPEFMAKLLVEAKPMFVPPETVIIREGEIGREMFILLSGSARVLDKNDTPLAVLTKGSYFGELTVIGDKRRRTSTVKTISPCELMAISKSSFERIVGSDTIVRDELRRTAEHLYGKHTLDGGVSERQLTGFLKVAQVVGSRVPATSLKTCARAVSVAAAMSMSRRTHETLRTVSEHSERSMNSRGSSGRSDRSSNTWGTFPSHAALQAAHSQAALHKTLSQQRKHSLPPLAKASLVPLDSASETDSEHESDNDIRRNSSSSHCTRCSNCGSSTASLPNAVDEDGEGRRLSRASNRVEAVLECLDSPEARPSSRLSRHRSSSSSEVEILSAYRQSAELRDPAQTEIDHASVDELEESMRLRASRRLDKIEEAATSRAAMVDSSEAERE